MKTTFTTFAIVTLVAVSSASADHDHQVRPARPVDLAHALHVKAETLEHEIEHHYPQAYAVQQRTYIISRLAVSTERELSHGHTFAAWQNLVSLDRALEEIDSILRQSIVNGRHEGKHIRTTVKEMESLAASIELSLRTPHLGHQGHNHFQDRQFGGTNSRFGSGNSRFGGGPVGHDDRGHGGRGDHDDHDHGGRNGYRGNDRVVNGPGVIYINRGGLSFGIRNR